VKRNVRLKSKRRFATSFTKPDGELADRRMAQLRWAHDPKVEVCSAKGLTWHKTLNRMRPNGRQLDETTWSHRALNNR
jgi:hypothetical protein